MKRHWISSLVPLTGVALLTIACGDDSGPPLADPWGRDRVDASAALDPDATPIRGPYLQAPAMGSMTVSWTTTEPSTSRVSFGPEGGSMTDVEGLTFLQVPTIDDPVTAGTVPVTYQHETVLEGLVDGQIYTYTVPSLQGAPGGRFMAPPAPGSDFRFFMFGDTRSNVEAAALVATGMASQMDGDGEERAFLLHTGDFVTAGGTESLWNAFFGAMGSLPARMPLLGVVGNHENSLGRTVFESLFKAPPTSTGTDRWYTANLDDLHLLVLDVYEPDLDAELAWMEADLGASTARFKVVALHVPLFTYSEHLPQFDLRDRLLPILEATGVQLVVCAHNHVYERFFGSGIQFVVSAGGGAPFYGIDDNAGADNTGAERRVAVQDTWHYLDAQVSGATLRVEARSVPDATALDCFEIDADAPGVELECSP